MSSWPARSIAAAVVAVAAIATPFARQTATTGPGEWKLMVLGIAQDAGIPQLGCNQELCRSIREGRRKPERVASLGLVNASLGKAYLFDATPDFVSQVHSLTGGRLPNAIFLTHGHIGHYSGLMFLGRESVDAPHVPVYGTAMMAAYLSTNGPWSLLVSRGNIDLQTIESDVPVSLGDGISVTALTVPHRDEFTDTVGYVIAGPHKKALFIPDIDQWQKWSKNIREVASTVDIAFLDGTFSSADEIPGRSTADIPHPLMPGTRDLLKGLRTEIWFIHINHTNREIDAPDVAKDGQTYGM
jgi:pyrroloquinoline quinone biosynthesis protein B